MKRSRPTRRDVLATTAALPAATMVGSGDADEELLWLGQEFRRLAYQLDQLIDCATSVSESDDPTLDEILRDLDAIEDAILQQKARTMAGLGVKARIVHWAKCEDLNPNHLHYLADRMMLSLIRDLVGPE